MVNFEEVLQKRKAELSAHLDNSVFIDYAGMKTLIDESVTRSNEIDNPAGQASGPHNEDNGVEAQNVMPQETDFFEAWNLELQKVKVAIERNLDGKKYCSMPCGPMLVTCSTGQMSRDHADALFAAIELNREGFRKIIKKYDKHHEDRPPAQIARLATFDLVMAGTMDRIEDLAMFDNRARGSKSQKSKVFGLFLLVAVIVTVTLASMQATTVQVAFATGLIASFLTAWGNAANDICNSVGTAVGCKALTLFQAVMWGAVFEVIGALTMGPYVSKSITKGIIITSDYESTPEMYAFGMVCVLFGTGSTTLLATFYGFPISATHGMIGGLVAIGLATKGAGSIGWSVIVKTCVGWVAAPLVGCVMAALIFLLISSFMRPHRNAAVWSARLQPLWLWLCLSVNIVFIFMKGPKTLSVKPVWKAVLLGSGIGLALVAVIFFVVWLRSKLHFKCADTIFSRRTASPIESPTSMERAELGEIGASHVSEGGAGVGEEGWQEEQQRVSEDAQGADAQRRMSKASCSEGEQQQQQQQQQHSRMAALKEMVAGKREEPEKPELRFTFRNYEGEHGKSVEAEKVKQWVSHPHGDEHLREHLDAMKHPPHTLHADERISTEGDVHIEVLPASAGDDEDDAENLALAEKKFVPLLIVSAFSVACAHGGNDVGNAIGPLAAILEVVRHNQVSESPDVPMWALVFGAAGFLIGIVTMGRLTIQTVGNKITELTPSKSFATQMAGAIAVLTSSAFGLPVSTSHCLVGAVVGIGMVQKCQKTGSVNMVVLGRIAMAWFVTIPLAMLVSVVVFIPFKHLFV